MMTDKQFAEKLRTVLHSGDARDVSQTCMSALAEQIEIFTKEYISKISSLLTTYEFEYRLGSFGVFVCTVSAGKGDVTPDMSALIAGEDAVKCISDTLNKAIQEKDEIC